MIGLHISDRYPYQEQKHLYFNAELGGHFFLVSFHSESDAQHYYEDSDFIVLFDGWVFNADTYATQCEFILRCFRMHQENFIYYLNGQFNLAIIEKKTHRFIIANDIFGLRTHFFLDSEDRYVYSPDIQFVREHAEMHEFDVNAIKVRLAYPRFQNRSTFYADVKFSGGCFFYDTQRSRIARYSIEKIESQYAVAPATPQLHLTEIRKTISKVHRGEKVLLELSGGLDSRFMLENILSTDSKVQTINWGVQVSDECTIARSVASSLGIPFLGIDLEASDFTSHAESHVQRYGGLDIFVQSAAALALSKAKNELEDGYIIETGLALDFYMRNSYSGQQQWLTPKPYVMDISEDLNIGNFVNFVERNRIFSIIALRQSQHREFYDDRYSMYDYRNYFRMRSFISNGIASHPFYIDVLKKALTKSKHIQIPETMFDLNLHIEYWDQARHLAHQKEVICEQVFKNCGSAIFHNRYYSDFNMWFRSDPTWIKLLSKFDNSFDRDLYRYISKDNIVDLIETHQSGKASLFSELINILTIDIMLNQKK